MEQKKLTVSLVTYNAERYLPYCLESLENQTFKDFSLIVIDNGSSDGTVNFFREKYPEQVKVYFIGEYSKEFCGGPHVTNTKEIGKVSIYKFEKIGSNLYRIYAK